VGDVNRQYWSNGVTAEFKSGPHFVLRGHFGPDARFDADLKPPYLVHVAKGNSASPTADLKGLGGWFFQRLRIEPWGQILVVLILIGGGILVSFLWSLGNRMTGVEQAVKDLPAQLDSKLEKLRGDLIEEFFKKAKQFTEARDFDDAAAAITAANVLIASAREHHEPLDDQFFVNTTLALASITPYAGSDRLNVLWRPINDGYSGLAALRSSLEKSSFLSLPRKELRSPVEIDSPKNPITFVYSYRWVTADHEFAGPTRGAMLAAEKGKFSVIEGDGVGAFVGGWQTLDYLAWQDFTFINMHIRYNGGPLVIKNVRFVNCSFIIVPDGNGRIFAESIALAKPRLELAMNDSHNSH
jgi:hypothetical protein